MVESSTQDRRINGDEHPTQGLTLARAFPAAYSLRSGVRLRHRADASPLPSWQRGGSIADHPDRRACGG